MRDHAAYIAYSCPALLPCRSQCRAALRRLTSILHLLRRHSHQLLCFSRLVRPAHAMALRGWVVAVEGFSVAAKTRIRTLLTSAGAEYAYSISPKVRPPPRGGLPIRCERVCGDRA